jgi:prepilin-type processing-associated H-X9-DG protein
MNALGITLLWCGLQVTVLGTLACVVYAACRKIGPAGRSTIALTGLLSVAGLSALAFSPWPRWEFPQSTANADSAVDAAPADVAEANTIATPDRDNAAARMPAATIEQDETDSSDDEPSFAALFLDSFRREMRKASVSVESPAQSWRWPEILAVLFLAGLAIGMLRLCGGLLAVQLHRRLLRNPAIEDEALIELSDVLQAELSCRRHIELRESASISSAATFGWWKSVILLPVEWHSWSAEERRAVLAHEIAHVARNDYLAWIVAQIGLVCHFYHPLVHWLAGRLRLEQELAADAAAAEVAGGQRAYLKMLAELALRQPDRPLSWPARTFLPTRRTFLRRIEMLRDSRNFVTKSSRGIRWLTVGLLAVTAIAVAGFRAPDSGGTSSTMAAQISPSERQKQIQRAKAQNAKQVAEARRNYAEAQRVRRDSSSDNRIGAVPTASIQVSYIPTDAVGVIAIRPAALLSRPDLKPLVAMLQKDNFGVAEIGNTLDKIEQITAVLLPPAGPRPKAPVEVTAFGGMFIRATEPTDFKQVIARLFPNAVETKTFGLTYFKASRPNSDICYSLLDDRTIVIDREINLQRLLLSGKKSRSKLVTSATWKTAANGHFLAAFDTDWLRGEMRFDGPRGGGPLLNPTMLAPFSPFWEDTDSLTISAAVDKKLRIAIVADCSSVQGAKRVKDTIIAAITLARNTAKGFRKKIRQSRTPEVPLLLTMINTADELLGNYQLAETGTTVQFSTSTDVNAAMLTPLFMAVQSARSAARRAQAMNNLKLIGLAMLNYHVTYNRFPPAMVYGRANKDKDKAGKVPHSWRVELLPFLEAVDLYNQYKFGEAWDSESNKKILAKMPSVFRNPNDDPKSTNASYYALVGEGTVFSLKDGVRIRNITDGTSYTLAVVEAKRSIPWTKPEDIPFDPQKELPKLGGWYKGGYNVLFCDGNVWFLADTFDKTALKWLIQRNDGHPVNLPWSKRKYKIPTTPPTDVNADEGSRGAGEAFGDEESGGSARQPSVLRPFPRFGGRDDEGDDEGFGEESGE